MIEIATNSELDAAANEFLAAALKYREALKRHSPRELGGVIWLRHGVRLVAYSENERYTQQVASMTFNTAKDELVFTEANELE